MVGGFAPFVGGAHRAANRLEMDNELVAGCFSRDPEKNAEAGKAFRVERLYASYEEMAAAEAKREDGIDYVVIATPNASHYEIARAFLEHGIHVVCEKPLCFTVAQAEELAGLAKEKNLLFAVTYTYMGYVMVKMARQLVRAGEIGRVINVSAEYPQEWLIDTLSASGSKTATLSGWRADPAVAGASNCVGDIGSHIENVVAYVTGLRIRRVAAAVDYFGQELDLNANILVEYDSGARGSYWCSQVSVGHYNDLGFRIFGTEGSVEWRQENPECLKVCRRGQPMQLYYRGTGNIDGIAAKNQRVPSGHVEGLTEAFANTYRNFMNAVRKRKQGEQPDEKDMDFPTVEDGLSGVRFINAVIESGRRDSAWVEL
jgi:predicted dehydrogenase